MQNDLFYCNDSILDVCKVMTLQWAFGSNLNNLEKLCEKSYEKLLEKLCKKLYALL